MSRPYRPRIVVEITTEQRKILNQYLAYGEQTRVFQAFLNDMIVLLLEYGHDYVSFMLDREFSYRAEVEEYANRRSGNTPTELVHAHPTAGTNT